MTAVATQGGVRQYWRLTCRACGHTATYETAKRNPTSPAAKPTWPCVTCRTRLTTRRATEKCPDCDDGVERLVTNLATAEGEPIYATQMCDRCDGTGRLPEGTVARETHARSSRGKKRGSSPA